jgi:hypothetical protein
MQAQLYINQNIKLDLVNESTCISPTYGPARLCFAPCVSGANDPTFLEAQERGVGSCGSLSFAIMVSVQTKRGNMTFLWSPPRVPWPSLLRIVIQFWQSSCYRGRRRKKMIATQAFPRVRSLLGQTRWSSFGGVGLDIIVAATEIARITVWKYSYIIK